jgi:hypothetical protein
LHLQNPLSGIEHLPEADVPESTIPDTMSTKPKIIKYRVALYISDQSPTELIATARHIVDMVEGNPYFPAPVPALADISQQTDVLEQAYDITLTKVRGGQINMLKELKKLHILLNELASYVEYTADLRQGDGSRIISSAGMAEHKERIKPALPFHIRPGKEVGSILLQYPGMRGALLVYQMTSDPDNAASWVQIHVGMRSKYTVTGLSSGVRYYFRAAFIRKGVQSAWSPIVNYLIQ